MFANQAGDSGNIDFKVRKFYSESACKIYYFSIFILLKIQLKVCLAQGNMICLNYIS